MRKFFNIVTLLVVIIASSCIKNDIPYPRIVADITAFQVRGQISSTIDIANKTVKLDLADTVNLEKVYLLKMEVSNEAKITPEPTSVINLSSPVEYVLTTYQDYIWTVSATQTIDRYFFVENQIGDAIIDTQNNTVLVTVSGGADLANLNITSAKLGPTGSVILPNISTIKNFTEPVQLTCVFNNKAELWTILVVKSSVTFSTKSVNPFAMYAIAEGIGEVGKTTYTFEYKQAGETNWTTFPIASVKYNGGVFSATIENLNPNTAYLVRAVDGANYAEEIPFFTEVAAQVPNSNFNDWCMGSIDPDASSAKKKSWFPDLNFESANYWWDTGNIGSNTLSSKNPTSPEETFVISGKAVKMASTAVVGVFAAASIYTGKYLKTDGIGAQLEFGKAFTSRPKSLKGYYSYTPGIIDKTKDPLGALMGKNDTCSIYIMLTTWTAPFEVNTKTQTFVDFNDPAIIAIAELYAAFSHTSIFTSRVC